MVALEVENLNGIVGLFAGIMLGPPLLLTIIGFAIKRQSLKTAIVLFVLAGLYLLVGLGVCGSLLTS
jgi:hypothetical protein